MGMSKVNTVSRENRNDNCNYELNYAFDHGDVEIFVVTMDQTMSNPRDWKDELKGMLGRYLFVNMCGDFDDENYREGRVEELVGHLSKAGIHPSSSQPSIHAHQSESSSSQEAQSPQPLPQLFAQNLGTGPFDKMFQDCPLTLNCAALWKKNPASRDNLFSLW